MLKMLGEGAQEMIVEIEEGKIKKARLRTVSNADEGELRIFA